MPKVDGVHIYVSTHDATNATRYYRWEYNEDWQFHSKYISTIYSNGVDSIKARTLDLQVYDCFGKDVSSHVIINSTTKLSTDIVYQLPLTVITANSEKIETKYSILVKQYALTSDAYGFWENIQRNSEKLGSIFDVLPSEAQSNFHCVSNPGELVIGFLSAGNPSFKRIFISRDQLLASYQPVYPYDCEIDTAYNEADPLKGQQSTAILIPASSPYIPVLALYIHRPTPFGLPDAYSYSTRFCVDCTLRGTKTRPAFWK